MLKPITFFSQHGFRPGAIVEYGGDHLTILVVEKRLVRTKRFSLEEEGFLRPLMQDGKPYPPEKFRETLVEASKRLGATKAAQRYLRD